MKKTPEYNLEDVVRILVKPGMLRLGDDRAEKYVMEKRGCRPIAARSYVVDLIRGLTADAFVESKEQREGDWFDVYGKAIDGCNLYIKFQITTSDDGMTEKVFCVSCHPCEHELTTISGLKLPPNCKGWEKEIDDEN